MNDKTAESLLRADLILSKNQAQAGLRSPSPKTSVTFVSQGSGAKTHHSPKMLSLRETRCGGFQEKPALLRRDWTHSGPIYETWASSKARLQNTRRRVALQKGDWGKLGAQGRPFPQTQSRGVEETKAADSSPTAALSQPRPGPATRLRSEEEPPVRLALGKGWPPPPPVPAGVGGGETPRAPPTQRRTEPPRAPGVGRGGQGSAGSENGPPGIKSGKPWRGLRSSSCSRKF